MSTRKYLARQFDPTTKQLISERIIEATSRNTARSHASMTTISVDLLNVNDAMRLAHTKVEIAGEAKAYVDPAAPDQLSLGANDSDSGPDTGSEAGHSGDADPPIGTHA